MRQKTIVLFFLFIPFVIFSQSITTTPHNLSAGSGFSIKASSESEICIFCHAPHNSRPVSPLWNRNDPGVTYTVYKSSTLQSLPGQPDGASILCLSCHDGTIALGNIYSRASDINFGSITTLPIGKNNLSTDLSDDHPISFIYNSALAATDIELRSPSDLSWPITLENEKVQCTSCHDPHQNTYQNFLLVTTQHSVLCLSCHQTSNWSSSIHATSNATWNGSGTNPWPHTSWNTVMQNGCENCHSPHNAGGKSRLLNFQSEESNCFNCHNGSVASSNLMMEFTKPYRHNITAYNTIHKPDESALTQSMHVECVDCHNPHSTASYSSEAPIVKGVNANVKGITQSGSEISSISYEYELCYRCHSSNSGSPVSSLPRQIGQNNVRLEFAPNNPSFHPVAGQGMNPIVPSLIPPLSSLSMIYCSDCHGSESANSPKGPHGSTFPNMLKLQYSLKDNTIESVSSYALCYSCHNRGTGSGENGILDNASFPKHDLHIRLNNIPCAACHDSHGISNTQGNSINNSNLINFNTSIVSPSSSLGLLKFED
ncbi:cytochrome c3 family protein, partial [Bacteroidota bacterium]